MAAIVLVLLASLPVALLSGRVARGLPPAVATRLLSAAAVTCAVTSAFVLAVLAAGPIAAWPPVAAIGKWSTSALHAHAPAPPAASLIALATLSICGLLFTRKIRRAGQEWLAAHRFCQSVGGSTQLIVEDNVPAGAIAIPGLRGGRIVASRQLLSQLPPDERRAVLAHEAAHLQYHHAAHRSAVQLAAALNPLLRPVIAAVQYSTERWSDESAASVAGRRTTARALLHAALDMEQMPGPLRAPAFSRDAVPQRVHALLDDPPRTRLLAGLLVACVTAGALLAAATTARHTELTYEQAADQQAASAYQEQLSHTVS